MTSGNGDRLPVGGLLEDPVSAAPASQRLLHREVLTFDAHRGTLAQSLRPGGR